MRSAPRSSRQRHSLLRSPHSSCDSQWAAPSSAKAQVSGPCSWRHAPTSAWRASAGVAVSSTPGSAHAEGSNPTTHTHIGNEAPRRDMIDLRAPGRWLPRPLQRAPLPEYDPQQDHGDEWPDDEEDERVGVAVADAEQRRELEHEVDAG